MFHIWITVNVITLTIFGNCVFHFWVLCCFVYGVLNVNLHENYMRDKMAHSNGLIEAMAMVNSRIRNNCIAKSRIHFHCAAYKAQPFIWTPNTWIFSLPYANMPNARLYLYVYIKTSFSFFFFLFNFHSVASSEQFTLHFSAKSTNNFGCLVLFILVYLVLHLPLVLFFKLEIIFL